MSGMCDHYCTTGHPHFMPKCGLGHWASLKCHDENACPDYKPPFDYTRVTATIDKLEAIGLPASTVARLRKWAMETNSKKAETGKAAGISREKNQE